MMEHRGFRIYGDAEPVVETLMGRISEWSPKGSIDYHRPKGPLVELTRFQLASIKVDDRELAECFGLELGRLLVDVCYHDFVIARSRIEEQLTHRSRSQH